MVVASNEGLVVVVIRLFDGVTITPFVAVVIGWLEGTVATETALSLRCGGIGCRGNGLALDDTTEDAAILENEIRLF